jgi:hypothetical protein
LKFNNAIRLSKLRNMRQKASLFLLTFNIRHGKQFREASIFNKASHYQKKKHTIIKFTFCWLWMDLSFTSTSKCHETIYFHYEITSYSFLLSTREMGTIMIDILWCKTLFFYSFQIFSVLNQVNGSIVYSIDFWF